MKKTYVIITIVAVVLIIAAITNPNQSRHKEVVKNKLTEAMQKTMSEGKTGSNNEWEEAGEAFGLMIGQAMIDQIVNNLVSTNNYVLFSTTKMSWKGESKVVGIGIFGNVFLTGELDKSLDKGILNNQ